MFRSGRHLFFCCIAALMLWGGAAVAKFDPSFVWTTLETPHFLVHYHQGGEETARRVAVIAEDVHSRLVPRIHWEPKEKTHVLLVDARDEANGATSPIPYNQIILFLARPAGGPGFGTTSYDDWMRLLITHEYTHVLQLDMVTGGPETVQKVLGRIYFPNLFQPEWMIEGLATYEETEETSGGRGRSPGAEMVIRTAVLENAFPELGQASVFPDSWPAGDLPYLFGEGFTRYLVEKYGREKVARVSQLYSSRKAPFLVGSTGEAVFGQSYASLWYQWQRSLKDRYGKERDAVAAQGLTSSTRLTDRGFVTTGPAFSPDGKHLAFAAVRGDEYPGVYLASADGSGMRKIVENVFPTSASGMTLAWSRDGAGIYYTKIEIERNTNYYDDLYYYDLAAEKEVRITRGMRARDPDPSPDGSKILFVTDRMGMTRLCSLDITAAKQRPAEEKDIACLTEWSGDQYETPRWSPDGKTVALGRWQPGGYRDIVLLDPSGKVTEEVTHDRAMDLGPAWSADSRYLYFSSDRTGIFNLYAYELGTKKLFQVTNVLNGAFAPSLSPDGQTIAFSSYSAAGYDIHAMRSDPSAWKSAAPYEDRYPQVQYAEVSVPTSTRPYSPLSTIYPRFWIPWFGYSYESGTLVGAFTFGQDVAERQRYIATVLYGPKNGRVWYDLDYFYDGFYPTVRLQAQDTDVTYTDFLYDGRAIRDYVERDRTLAASAILPLLKNASQHELTVGYRYRILSPLSDLPPWPGYAGPLPGQGNLISGTFGYAFNDSHRYAFSISPEGGRTIALDAERFAEALGSDYQYTKYTADWFEYIDMPWKHHVLLVRAFAGTSTGTPPPQGAFQLGGDNLGDITLTTLDRVVNLRGYPTNTLRGRKAALGTLEYRFPVVLLEEGWDTKAIYARKLHGAVFFEAGNAWDNTMHASELRRSVGAEARLDLQLAYYLPITLRFVVAKGLDPGGEGQAYLGIWMPLDL